MKRFISSIFILFVYSLFSNFVFPQQGGFCLKFDGLNDYVSLPNNASFQPTGGNFTSEAWIRLDADGGNDQKILMNLTWSGGVKGYAMNIYKNGSGNFYFAASIYLSGSQYWVSDDSYLIAPNVWTHVAMTWSVNGYLRAYVNGKLIGETSTSSSIYTSTSLSSNMGCGNGGNWAFFKGQIDEMRVWDVERSANDIRSDMYKEILPQPNLKAYYKMTNGSGTSLTDNSENSNNATILNETEWRASTCFSGPKNALDFDGLDDQVLVPAIDNPTGSFTLEAYAKMYSSGYRTILSKITNGWQGFSISYVGSRMQVVCGNSSGYWSIINSLAPWTLNKWYHVAFVYNSANDSMYYYQDGLLQGTAVVYPTYSPTTFMIGNDTWDELWHGAIDEVRVWNIARADSDIRETMYRTLSGNESGLVAYYRFDEKDGTTLYDSSPNAKNGTLTNMTPASDWISSNAFNTWLGTESDSWSTSLNWSLGTVPIATAKAGVYKWDLANRATIPNVTLNSLLFANASNPNIVGNLDISSALFVQGNVSLNNASTNTVGSLMVSSGSELSIPNNAKLTINTNLNNAGRIVQNSNLSSSAQILNNGTLKKSGEIVVRKSFKAANGWNFVSFPFDVTAANVKLAGTSSQASWGDLTSGTGFDFYAAEYDGQKRDNTGVASYSDSPNWKSLSPHAFLANKGYIIAVTSDIDLDFVSSGSTTAMFGTTASLTVNQYENNAKLIHHSWNLVGNPFSLSFDLLQATQTQTPFYIYSGSTYHVIMDGESYQTNPFSCFFLQAQQTNLDFGSSGRLLKAPMANYFDEISLSVSNSNYEDKTRVRLQEEAQADYELGKDAVKMMSLNSLVPQIYTNTNGYEYAVNSLPDSTTGFDLKLKIGEVGDYTITLDNKDLISSTFQEVTLVDDSVETNLLETGTYTITAKSKGTKSMRVKLVPATLSVPTSISNILESGIVVNNKKDKVSFTGLQGLASVEVYDISGKLIQSFVNVQDDETLTLKTVGLNILNIKTQSQKANVKIVVN